MKRETNQSSDRFELCLHENISFVIHKIRMSNSSVKKIN